jgi:hypothetical protein
MLVGTAITTSHLSWARVLAASFAEQHPDAPPVAVLVVDDVDGVVGGAGEPFELLRPVDIGIDDAELHRRGAMYQPMELAGSTRALLLATLLERAGGGPVAFADADVLVCGSLDPVAEQVARDGIVLSPHLLAPPARPEPIERALLLAGSYNCGFLGVAGEAGARFTRWWAGHLERDCISDQSGGLFVSQRWLDLAPGLFGVANLADPGTNVTVHNLGARVIAEGPAIDGAPLRLLHVGGDFDPRAGSWPRLATSPVAHELLEDYARRLIAAGHVAPAASYGFATASDGTVLEPWVRRAVRAALLDGDPAPDPFTPGSAFTEWLAAAPEPPASRWALALRAHRRDIAAAFPAVPGADAPRYVRWLGIQEEIPIPARFAPPAIELEEERAAREVGERLVALDTARQQAEAEAETLRAALATAEGERDADRAALATLRSNRALRASQAGRRALNKLLRR